MTKPAVLVADENKDLMRFVTCGSVDDGKSTLIGRLLFESKGIYEDQLDALKGATSRGMAAREGIDLALVTDGLKAEREQGITIDVAYRYFSTPKRKFIIADSPGHEQYTRNMATGASTANLAVILIDASLGVLTQSKRHAFIVSLLGIPHVLVAVNKMDLVDYAEEVFRKIVDDMTEFTARLQLPDVTFIPISALEGDNVTHRTENMSWYSGPTLLGHLEQVHIASDRNLIDLRFPVQLVSRPDANFRGYMGTPAAGVVRKGDELMALPSGVKSKVREVYGPEGPVPEAFPPLPCTITLEDEIDVSRGDVFCHPNNLPRVDNLLEAMVVWMAEDALDPKGSYLVKHATRTLPAKISEIRYRVDVNTLRRSEADTLRLNEIGRCLVELARPVAFDPYRKCRGTGSFIIIDRLTRGTVGAGMIVDRRPEDMLRSRTKSAFEQRGALERQRGQVTREQRAERLGHGAATLWLTGLTGAGKSTIAFALEKRLFDMGVGCHVLDGENTRLGLSLDLGFSIRDRAENVRRAAEVAGLFNDAGLISICAFVSPFDEDREMARRIVGEERFHLVHLSAPLEVCKKREGRGFYERAERGELRLVPGISAPFEAPSQADLELPTHELDVETSVDRLVEHLKAKGVLR